MLRQYESLIFLSSYVNSSQLSLPEVSEDYLHRAGRTGRLGRPGKVVTVTRSEQDFVIQRFQNELGIQIIRRNLKVLKAKPPA